MARGAILGLCLANITFVVGVSSAVTYLESSRYRYQIESLIWVTTAVCVSSLWGSAMRHSTSKTVSDAHFS
jgi:Ca2+/Na+ antiporter